MGNERLTLEIATKAIGQESIDRLSASLDRFSAASESSGARASSAYRKTQESADASTGSLRRLFLAAKDFGEGRNSFATVEAGYFAASLGAIGIAAGVATAAVIGVIEAQKKSAETNEKMVAGFGSLNLSLRLANDSLLVTNDRLANEIAKLEGKPQNGLKLALDEAREASDKLAESLDKTFSGIEKVMKDSAPKWYNVLTPGTADIMKREFGVSGLGGFRARIAGMQGDSGKIRAAYKAEIDDYLQPQLDEAKTKQSRAIGYDKVHDTFGPRIETLQEYIRQYSGEIANIDLTTKNTSSQGALAKAQSSKAFAESQKKQISEEEKAIEDRDEANLGKLKQDHELILGEERAYWEKRLDFIQLAGERYSRLQDDYNGRIGAAAQKDLGVSKRVAGELQNMTGEGWDRIAKGIDAQQDRDNENVIRDASEGSRVEDLKSRGNLDSRLYRLDLQRQAVTRASSLNSGGSQSQTVAARIAESRQLTAIDRQEGQLRLNEEATLLSQIAAADTKAREEQAGKIVELAKQTNLKIYEDTTRTLELIHEEQLRQMEDFKSEVGGVYDAITSRTPHALQNLVRQQILALGRSLTEDAAQHFLLPQLKKIPGILDPHGSLSRALHIDGDKTTDLHKIAVAADTAALEAHTRALALSASGGGGGLPSTGSLAAASGNPDSLPLDAGGMNGRLALSMGPVSAPDGLQNYAFTNDGLPTNGGGMNAQLALSTGKVSSFGFNTQTVGSIAAAAGSAYAAASGFSKGGAGGALQGAAGVAGIASSVLPMISGALSLAGPIGAVAGIGLGLLSGLFNGPQRRANQLNQELSQAQYIAPQALNVTESSSGTFVDFDAKGKLRDSNFSPYPTVRQGSVWEQTHGLFGGPPTFYQVPGGQTSQFGAPVTQHIYHINAIDTQSFAEALDKNHLAVAGAAAKGLQNAHGPLTAEVQRAAGTK